MIGQANLTISADNKSMTYGGTLPALTATYTTLVNGDTSAAISGLVLSTVPATSHAGSYAITASGATDPDYNITLVNGTLTIGQANLTISADNKSMTYGGTLPALTATYTTLVNGDTSAAISGLVLSTVPATSHAGSYAITASGATDPDYKITLVNGTLMIGQANLTISADNKSMTYGGTLPALTATYTTLVNGDTSAAISGLVLSTVPAMSHAGSYAITASGAVDPDYKITLVNGTLTIGQAALTVTAVNKSMIYGTALPTLTASYSGFVNGDTSASLTTQPTLTTTATVSSPVAGSPYSITASGAVDSDYAISYVAGTLTVASAGLTITVDNQTKVYGAALPILTVSYSGFINGDTPASLTTLPTVTTTATASSHVSGSPYSITASGAVDSDYSISYVAGSLTVTAAPLTITANNQTKVYGAALPTLTASYSGFVNGDTSASLTTQPTLTTTATASSHVAGSPYSITASGAVDSDYSISYVAGSLTVTPAPLTITANDQTKVYGAALPTLTASYSGFVNGDTSASLSTQPTLTTTATASSHVAGSPYSITASGAVDSDYSISYVAGNLTVTAAPLTITANNQTKVYGAALPTLTASYSGFVNGDSAASLSTQPTLTTTATASSHVAGSPYSITASGAVDPDYSISYVAGSLTVTTAPLTITANNQTKVYGAALPTLTASYSGFVNGDTSASLSMQPTLTTTATASSHVAGSPYSITASGAVDSDYSISYVAGNLIVTAAPLTITADNQTKVYGAALPTLTASYSGFVNGDTSASLTTQPTLTTTATASSHVAGSPYSITASGAVDSDYSISYVAGNLIVTAAPLTITANNQTKVYGAALPTLTASYSGFVNGDTSASLSTQPTLTTTATASSHVSGNPYSITASGAVDSDYAISYVAGTLTVTPAALTITADNQTKVYGAALPSLTASYSGFVNGDSAASLTTQPTLTTTATASSHVAGSPYSITASGAVDPDYSISYVAGKLIVTAAPLTITANNQTKVYGAAPPTLTASYSGFVNGDTSASLTTQPTLTTTATAGSHVAGSPYSITASGAVDPDYSISYVAGNLTVTAAPLTITANDQTKVYGATLPTLTASYSGFVNGDTSASLSTQPTLTTTAAASSHVAGSPYSITASGAVDRDYSISYVGGSLIVTPAGLTITANNQTNVYGAALPTLTASYSGFVNGDTSASLTTQPTLTTTATASSHVAGSPYSITASGAVDTDYSISYVAGSLTVTPAGLTITANNQTKVYGAALPALTASYSGFVNGDSAASLTTQPTLTTTATASSHVAGSPYSITASGAVDSDYSISYVGGSLIVTAAPLTITANNQTKVYGVALPTLTASYSGFVNGDTSASLTTQPTLTTTATASSHVAGSPYSISASDAVDLDYAISYVAGALTVTPTALTITADNQTMVDGAALPTLTASYSGFVNGDTAASLTIQPTLTTTATTSSSVAGSPYAITASGAVDTDYSISYAAGILTVTASGSLGGSVYVDANNDGVLESGEAGLGGVLITLAGVDSHGNPVTATTTTASTGAYLFTDVRSGTYSITASQPAGYVAGEDTIGNRGGTNPAVDQFTGIVLASGTSGSGYNFGARATASLALGATLDDATPNVGQQVTYTLTIQNSGPDDATDVVVAAPLPSGLSLDSATPSRGLYDAITGDWTITALAEGATATLSLAASVDSPVAQTLVATISGSDQASLSSVDQSASVTEVPQSAALALTTSFDQAAPNVGDTIHYLVTLTNNGPDTATDLAFNGALPAGLVFVSATTDAGAYDPASGALPVGTLAPGASVELTVAVRVASPDPQTIVATATADQYDPALNGATATVTATPQVADLALTSTISSTTPNVGDRIKGSVTLTDNGPAAASGVVVAVPLPLPQSGLTFQSVVLSQGTYDVSTGLWNVGGLAQGAGATLSFVASVTNPDPEAIKAVVAQADQYDPVSTNNTTSVVETPQQADLKLTETVSDAQPNLGDTIEITTTLVNNGPDAATNVNLQSLLPAPLVLVSATPSQGNYDAATGLWSVGSVGVSGTATLVLSARVGNPTPASVTATVLASDQYDTVPANNSSTVGESIQVANLILTETVSNPKPVVGETVNYTVSVSNRGPDSATNVTATAPLPTGLTFISAVFSQGSYDQATGIWTLGSVATGVVPTLTLTAEVSVDSAQTTTASISSVQQYDPNPTTFSQSVTVTPQTTVVPLPRDFGSVPPFAPIIGTLITGSGGTTSATVSGALTASSTSSGSGSGNNSGDSGDTGAGSLARGQSRSSGSANGTRSVSAHAHPHPLLHPSPHAGGPAPPIIVIIPENALAMHAVTAVPGAAVGHGNAAGAAGVQILGGAPAQALIARTAAIPISSPSPVQDLNAAFTTTTNDTGAVGTTMKVITIVQAQRIWSRGNKSHHPGGRRRFR